ncbi:MAG: hypothetical protein Q8O30_01475 [Candidatus Omnitrophota bacterium]|nr:hypothetical protein [Candidatus Omnitrophota bacterium]
MRKIILGVFAVYFLILVSGCSTVANVSEGLGRGVAEDIGGTAYSLKKLNHWIEENWW